MAEDPKARKPDPVPDPGPHYYIATEDLYVGHPESGTVPARAFTAGDRVPAVLVDANGWQQQVRRPDNDPPPRSAPAAVPPTTASKE